MKNSVQTILDFLADVRANNNREWFAANRARYDEARTLFRAVAEDMIARIGAFDASVAGMPVEQTLYRFYRDTRFSADKSPYKRHMGTFINARGKKSQHGGYYLHLEPGACLIAVGTYWHESRVVRAIREEIALRTDEFAAIVDEAAFRRAYTSLSIESLKTMPKGFPKDFPRPELLRMKDFCASRPLPDNFFAAPDWPERAACLFRTGKPYMDFINEVVDDYIDE